MGYPDSDNFKSGQYSKAKTPCQKYLRAGKHKGTIPDSHRLVNHSFLQSGNLHGFNLFLIGMSLRECTLRGKLRVKQVPRYSQIGNAIPPLFAEIVGHSFKEIINA